MTKIRFQQTPEFRPIVQQAQAAAANGKPSPEAIAGVEALANANGSMSVQESLIIQALREGRPETMRSLSLIGDQADFELDVRKSPLPKTSSSVDIAAAVGSNPLGAGIRDRGEEVYGKAKDVLNFMAKGRLQDALGGYLADKPALKASVDAFMSRLPDQPDREAMAYMKALLIDRQPPLPADQQQALLDKLVSMSRTDYDHRTGATRELLVSALHDIALPSDIAQHNIGTCAGTCAQIKLAQEFPQEYLKMLDTLSQNQTYTSLAGKEIKPNWSFTNEGWMNKSGRSPSSAVMQNAIMDFADGERREYASSSKDDKVRGGLYLGEAERIFEALFNQEFVQEETAIFGTVDKENNIKAIEELRKLEPSRSKGVYLSMKFAAPGQRDAHHAILLIGIQGDRATYINPWGREESIRVSQIESRLTGYLRPNGAIKPPPPPDPDAEKKYLEALARTAREQAEKNRLQPPEPVEPVKGKKGKK